MNEQKKMGIYIGGVLLIILALFFFLRSNNSQKNTPVVPLSTETSPSTLPIKTENAEVVDNTPQVPTENPGDLVDIVNQPAYLVSAYADHEKNLIGVDYVILFKGQEAVNAQVEDGVCSSALECQIPPTGYIRNVNPHFRTIEIATSTPLSVEVSGVIFKALVSKGIQNPNPSFDVLKEVVPTMPAFTSSKTHFKEAKTFVFLTIKNGAITKIIEPSQE